MNEALRALFPITRHYVYLNHAAVGPLSTRSLEAIQRFLQEATTEAGVKWMAWMQEAERVRRQAARLINAKPSEIAFMQNTSAALSAIANGIDWRVGDNVVSCGCEFPSNIYPWMRLQQYGVQLRLAPERNGRLETDELLSLVDERTRVIAVSFVQFINGFRMDLSTIGRFCRQRGILFVVDAIQGLGALKLDVERDAIDALAADAHKFLLGPEGITIMYVSERVMPLIQPTIVGWTSVKNSFDKLLDYELDYRDGALRYEQGSLNAMGIHALGASLDLFLEVGIEGIEQHLLSLTDYLVAGLQAKGYRVISSRRPGEASAIVCCTHDRYSAVELHRRLLAHRIVVVQRLGRLRISPHLYNTVEEIETLLAHLP